MQIGELSRRTGVSERSLRYYEDRGMLASDRTPSGRREYTESAVDRVVHIQALFAAGLRSQTIAELLPCMRNSDGAAAPHATSRLIDTLLRERARLEAEARDIRIARDVLDEMIDAAGTAAPAEPT